MELATTKKFCANVGPRNEIQFLNPSMGNVSFTKENGREAIGALQ